MKTAKVILVNLVVLVVVLELVSMIYIRSTDPHIPGYNYVPSYLDIMLEESETLSGALEDYATTYIPDPIAPKAIDTLYPWCTWHPANQTNRHTMQCFDVISKFSELGTRGPLPDTSSTNTIFFIGDSYVDGYGLEQDSTLPERVRRKLDVPVLNLGTSGNFGTTQMSLVYKGFAEKFKHSHVYVFFYLNNDFQDNDIKRHDPQRYRPYRVMTGDSSEIVYRGHIDSSAFSWKVFYKARENNFVSMHPRYTESEGTLTRITKLSYTRRMISLLKFRLTDQAPAEPCRELNYTESDWAILEHDIRFIKETAALHGARVTFSNLPSKQLFDYVSRSEEIIQQYANLEDRLANAINGKNSQFESFYKYIFDNNVNPNDLFFPCDFHYSNFGESVLTDFVISIHQ